MAGSHTSGSARARGRKRRRGRERRCEGKPTPGRTPGTKKKIILSERMPAKKKPRAGACAGLTAGARAAVKSERGENKKRSLRVPVALRFPASFKLCSTVSKPFDGFETFECGPTGSGLNRRNRREQSPENLVLIFYQTRNMEAYAKYVKEYYLGKFGASLQTYDQQYLKNTSLGEDGGDRLWWFQVCTEVAYFQVAPKNDSVRSPRIDSRYHLDLCKNVFGEGIYPEVDITNIYYGGTRIAGSKIIFTNGSQDPWRHASKQTSSPEKDMPSYITKCHNCGHGTDLRGCPQSPLNIEGDAGNCTSPVAVQKVRERIIEHIDLWLSQCDYKGPGVDEPEFFGAARGMVSAF